MTDSNNRSTQDSNDRSTDDENAKDSNELAEERTEWSEERTEWAEERTKWAEERTKWADQRVFLAQERTYSAWIRTGTGSMAVGFAIVRFMEEVRPQWVTKSTGLLFILIGGFIIAMAFIHYRRVSLHMKRTKTPAMGISTRWLGLVSGVLLLCAIGGAILVFGPGT